MNAWDAVAQSLQLLALETEKHDGQIERRRSVVGHAHPEKVRQEK